jgi:hypothetical protein
LSLKDIEKENQKPIFDGNLENNDGGDSPAHQSALSLSPMQSLTKKKIIDSSLFDFYTFEGLFWEISVCTYITIIICLGKKYAPSKTSSVVDEWIMEVRDKKRERRSITVETKVSGFVFQLCIININYCLTTLE